MADVSSDGGADAAGEPAGSRPEESNVRVETYRDPLALRALAHPLRLQLQGLVAREGTLTAADAARQLGISHALASHHLRQLAKYGFIEPAAAPDSRAHPWRVRSTSFVVEIEGAESRATADQLDRWAVERAGQQLAQWQARRAESEVDWGRDVGVRGALLYLTPEELSGLMRAWNDLIMPLADLRPVGHHDRRPPGTVPISFTLVDVPLPPTEHGG